MAEDKDDEARRKAADAKILEVSKEVAAHAAIDEFCLLVPQIRLFPVHIPMLRRRLQEGALDTKIGNVPPGRSAIFYGPNYVKPDKDAPTNRPTVVFSSPAMNTIDSIHGRITAFHELAHFMQYFSGQYLRADSWDREVSAYMAAARWHQLVHKKPYSSAGAVNLPQVVMDEARRLVTSQDLRHEFSKTEVADLRRLIMAVTKSDGMG